MKNVYKPIFTSAAVGTILTFAPGCHAASDPTGDSPIPEGDIISLDASGADGRLTVTLTTAADYEFSNTQLLIDTDMDTRTGFVIGTIGADLLVEGGNLLKFKGDDQTAWSWTPAGTVQRRVEGATLTVTVPGNTLGENRVALVAQTLSNDYAGLDQAPEGAGLMVNIQPAEPDGGAAKPAGDSGVLPASESTGDTTDATRDLTKVESEQVGGKAAIRITTAERFDFASTLTFFDADGDADTGYQPSADPKFGFDFVISGGTISKFSGDTRQAWEWESVGQAELSQSGNTLSVKFNPALLGADQKLRFVVWNMTADWQGLVDQAPDAGLYTLELDPSKVQSAAPAAPIAMAAPKANADLPARQRVAESDSFYCYYGSGKVAELSHYDVAVLHSPQMAVEDIARLKKQGVVTIGYITVGEDDTLRVGDGTGPDGQASWYFDRDDDGQPDQNPIWKSWYANTNDPNWRADRVKEAKRLVEQEGYDGIFLDTIDTAQLYPEGAEGMVKLIADFRKALPDSPIILNQGFTLFDQLAPMADGLMLESFTATYDFQSKTYMLNYDASLDSHTRNVQRNLEPVLKQHPMPIFVLDYTRPDDTEVIQIAADRAATFGYQFAAAPIFLDEVYINDIRGKANPKWLEMQATPETMSIMLAEPANGFPAGTRLMPSSCYAGYTVAPLVDGIEDRSELNWTKAAWASSEDGGDAWLRFIFPQPQDGGDLQITWATDTGRTHVSQQYEVQTRSTDGDWQSVGAAQETTADQTVFSLPDQPFDEVRLHQPEGGGSEHRPDLMWIAQIEYLHE